MVHARWPIPILVPALFVSCGNGSDEIEGAPPAAPPGRTAAPDPSSPMTAAKTFSAAYLAKDVATAAACVADTTTSDQLRRILAEVKTTVRNGRHVSFLTVRTATGWKVEKFDI